MQGQNGAEQKDVSTTFREELWTSWESNPGPFAYEKREYAKRTLYQLSHTPCCVVSCFSVMAVEVLEPRETACGATRVASTVALWAVVCWVSLVLRGESTASDLPSGPESYPRPPHSCAELLLFHSIAA
jgi:hypothetical protein